MTAVAADIHYDGFGTVSTAELAIAAAQAGDATAAEAALAKVDAAVQAGSRITAFAPDLARHWVAAACGELSRAMQIAIHTAGRLGESGVHAAELIVLHDVVRFGGASRVAGRLAELATICQGQFPQWSAAHARASADGDGAALETVAHTFEQAGLMLHAAEAFAQASQAWHDTGRTAPARAAAAKAWNLAAHCDNAQTPALARLHAPALTSRELEIATLAASGMTSKQIADRLVVSIRTIDNHLRAAYAKLGIASRAELSDVITRP